MSSIRPTFVCRLWRAVGLLVLVMGSANLAVAQEAKASDPEPISDDVDRLLWDRGREVLHPTDPLALVGVEQGDNDFRHRTPLLQQSDRVVARVDPEENHLRRLSMYTEGRRFHVPLALAASTASPARSGPARSADPISEIAEESEESSWLTPFLLVGLLMMVLVGVVWARYRIRPVE